MYSNPTPRYYCGTLYLAPLRAKIRDFRLLNHPTVCAQEVLDLRFVMMFLLAEPRIQIIRRSWVLHNARAYNVFLGYERSVAEDFVIEASAVSVD